MSDLYFLSLSSRISFIDGPECSSVAGAFGGFGDFVTVTQLAIDCVQVPGGGAVGVFVFGIYPHSDTPPKCLPASVEKRMFQYKLTPKGLTSLRTYKQE